VIGPRVIVHADMDAFYAAVEQLDDPSLRGKPVIVGHPGRRGVVTTASYEARPFGVGSAMPMARAVRLCPQAIVVPPRFGRYEEVSRAIMRVFGDFSPLVEPLSLDEAFLDMTGTTDLFGSAETMGKLKSDVREATGGLTVSVGIAPTKYVAKVASDLRKPDGLTIVPDGEVLDFLWPLPVKRLWGIGPRGAEQLAEMGLQTIGDVARAEREWLERELGALGEHIHRLAHNDDPREVIPWREPKSVGSEETLEWDVRGADQIRPLLLKAADRVAYRLRRSGLVARGVRVKLKTSRFELYTRQVTLLMPTSSADEIYPAALDALAKFDLSEPMRLVGLATFDLCEPADPAQRELFDDAAAIEHQRRARLDRALDDMRARFGHGAIKRASDLDG
jgi:DNA polymerase-4